MTYDIRTAELASALANVDMAKRAMGLNLQLLSKEDKRLFGECNKIYDEIHDFYEELWAELDDYIRDREEEEE